MFSPLSFALLLVLAAFLVAAAALDLRSRTIPNALNGAIALLAIPFWWSLGLALWPEVALQIGVALLVFALFAAAFALGAMGGGDVKMAAAVALWLPAGAVLGLLLVMSLAGGALTAAMLVARRLRRSQARIEVPYGVAIACGGLWVISEPILNQFA